MRFTVALIPGFMQRYQNYWASTDHFVIFKYGKHLSEIINNTEKAQQACWEGKIS